MKWPLIGAALGFSIGVALAWLLIRFVGVTDKGWAGVLGYACGTVGVQAGFIGGMIFEDRS